MRRINAKKFLQLLAYVCSVAVFSARFTIAQSTCGDVGGNTDVPLYDYYCIDPAYYIGCHQENPACAMYFCGGSGDCYGYYTECTWSISGCLNHNYCFEFGSC